MKKIFIIMLIMISGNIIYGESFINANFGIDLKVGYNTVDFSNFGQSYSNIFKYGFGLNQDATSINALYIKGGNIKYFLMKNLAINLKADVITIENKDILHDELLDKDTIESNLLLNALYIGIGPKYYLGFDFLQNIFPYINIDAGYIMLMNSSWEVKAKSGTSYYSDAYKEQTTALEGSGFSASIELGTEIIIYGIGINIGGGYRYANIETVPEKKGVFKIKQLNFNSMNLSGAYVNGGMAFYFGEQVRSSSETKYTDLITNEEKYGDYYYAKKDYTKALYYYNEAIKIGATRTIYKKIGLAYYGLGNKLEAKNAFEKYLQHNPEDMEVKNWVERMR